MAQQKTSSFPQEKTSANELLIRLCGELETAAKSCSTIQWTISVLLEKVQHPDLGAEIHMLQDIDRLQQTLCDVTSVLNIVSMTSFNEELEIEALSQVVRLESVRARLGLSNDIQSTSIDSNEIDVTWF